MGLVHIFCGDIIQPRTPKLPFHIMFGSGFLALPEGNGQFGEASWNVERSSGLLVPNRVVSVTCQRVETIALPRALFPPVPCLPVCRRPIGASQTYHRKTGKSGQSGEQTDGPLGKPLPRAVPACNNPARPQSWLSPSMADGRAPGVETCFSECRRSRNNAPRW